LILNNFGFFMDKTTPAQLPVATPEVNAAPITAVLSKKPNWKTWLIVGGVVIVIALFALLLMRSRSKRLSEELERRTRDEMAEKSKQEVANLQMMQQQYWSQYPPGLMQQPPPYDNSGQSESPPPNSCSGGSCSPPAQQSQQPVNHVASPAGAVRELPDEQPPRVAVPAPLPAAAPVVAQQPPPPQVVPQQQAIAVPIPPMPSLIDDPFLTPLDNTDNTVSLEPINRPASPQQAPLDLQNNFRIDVSPEELLENPFAPIVKPIPAVSPPSQTLEAIVVPSDSQDQVLEI
jgi:hypothetical protein